MYICCVWGEGVGVVYVTGLGSFLPFFHSFYMLFRVYFRKLDRGTYEKSWGGGGGGGGKHEKHV